MKTSDWNRKETAFSSEKLGKIIMIKLPSNPMLKLTGLRAKAVLLEYLDRILKSSDVRVVIFHSNPENSGRMEYHDFYEKLLHGQMDRQFILRMYNAVNQLIVKLLELNQVTIHINSGQVIMMFLNISQACDYRIIAENTIFQNPCMELGMIPKGGGAYFLAKRLGHAKAFEIMTSCQDITALNALALGMVNQVAPLDQLEKTALEAADNFIKNPAQSLAGVKRLLNYCMKDIHDYLAFENDEMMRIVDNELFGK